MDKYFVCLANSYKHGGRCIAGIEVLVTPNGYSVVKENGRPKWIRPICKYTDAGAIPNEIALNINLLAIVKMTNVILCPMGAQSENAYFDKLQPIGVFFEESKIQNYLVDNSRTTLFFNYRRAVVPDVYNRLGDHSILLIKANDAEIYGDTTYTDYPRFRVNFHYHSHQYDLPITDPWYIQDVRDGKKALGYKGDIFITCSLGVEHEGWHSKLAACIIDHISSQQSKSCHTIGNSRRKGDSAIESTEMYYNGYSPKEIAERRGIQLQTVYNHLFQTNAIKAEDYITPSNYKKAKEIYDANYEDRSDRIHEFLDEAGIAAFFHLRRQSSDAR